MKPLPSAPQKMNLSLASLLVPTLLMSTLLGVLSLAHPLAAQESAKPAASTKAYAQPKNCFVHTAKASLRCGPGSQFYATTILERGTPVDVYVETPDGWSGIRPPEGSHNWIPASSVYMLPGGKSAEVSVDKVAAFIGSDSAEVDSFLFQTELIQSQTVAVLGEATREEKGKQSLWFRIAPPPGEFRWIRTSQLGSEPVQHVTQASANTPPREQAVQPASDKRIVQPKSSDDASVVVATNQEPVNDEVVWSDEDEQIARIEQEIQREQAQAASDATLEIDETPQRPRKKASRATAYGQDQKYWNSLQDSDHQPLKVGPVGGVLGWLGISVVEDSPSTHPGFQHPQSPRTNHYGEGILSPRGPTNPQSPLIESRIDRLPRPTRRYADGSWWSSLQSEGPLFGADANSDAPLLEDSFSTEPIQPRDRIPASAASYSHPISDAPRDRSSTPERFQTPSIQEALLQLTAMVAKPTEQWNLEPFRVSAKSWIELGESPLVRGEARLLLDRIEEFESLRARTLSVSPASPSTAPPQTEAVSPRIAGSGSEASGWLVSVHTSLPGQPEFALTDDAGKVIAYVRPTTGLNLRRYVQQPVTVYGAPGYIPNLAAKQIIAERVVRLR